MVPLVYIRLMFRLCTRSGRAWRAIRPVFKPYLAGVSSSSVLPSTEHGGSYPPQVVLVADVMGQDGHVHLLQSVDTRTI